jgi:hypothetical protein
MKTLLAGTSYVDTELKLWLVQQWDRIGKKLNPETDLLIIDSNSPIPIENLPNSEIYQFGDNIGHLESTSRDGWGRAMCKAVEISIERNYDWLVTFDTDLIFTKQVYPIIFDLICKEKEVGSTRSPIYGWLEGIFFFSVPWLKRNNFIEKYNWPAMKKGIFPERYMESLIGFDLYDLQLKGIRDDWEICKEENLFEVFPNGCDWLTHCKNQKVYEKLIINYNL